MVFPLPAAAAAVVTCPSAVKDNQGAGKLCQAEQKNSQQNCSDLMQWEPNILSYVLQD